MVAHTTPSWRMALVYKHGWYQSFFHLRNAWWILWITRPLFKPLQPCVTPSVKITPKHEGSPQRRSYLICGAKPQVWSGLPTVIRTWVSRRSYHSHTATCHALWWRRCLLPNKVRKKPIFSNPRTSRRQAPSRYWGGLKTSSLVTSFSYTQATRVLSVPTNTYTILNGVN